MSAGSVIGILGQGLIDPAAAGPGPITVDDLVPIMGDIAYRFSIIADLLDATDRSAAKATTAATEAATQLEVVGQDVKDITNQTYTVVIPHSLSWLSGYLVSHFIAPLQSRVGTLEEEFSFLAQWRAQIVDWRNEFVDPNVELWVGFRQFFDSWPQSILFMWKDWLANPDHFAQWAAAPLIGPLVSYLADPAHKQTRDNLTDIISQAWAEESTKTLDDLYTFLLANT